MRLSKRLKSYYREFMYIAKGTLMKSRPVLVHMVASRRCNLSCTYCTEYDDYSDPIPRDILLKRIDKLAELGTLCITISGGEPLLHPDLEKILAHGRKYGMLIGSITNGYLLTQDRIRALNDAGLEYLQMSIDNVRPDEVSKKSLKLLDKKLVWLAELAEFKVNINSVIGCGVKSPEDALVIARRAMELGFSTSVGVTHDEHGALKPLSVVERKVFAEIQTLSKTSYSRVNSFQQNLANAQPNRWRCRAGARYLYVCENGLVHYCSQQRGYPAIPLKAYRKEDIQREYATEKACAPFCTVSCVHQVALFDSWRDPQRSSSQVRHAPPKVVGSRPDRVPAVARNATELDVELPETLREQVPVLERQWRVRDSSPSSRA